MSAGTKNGILIGVIVVAGAIAVWRFVGTSRANQYPDSADSATHWMCEQCGEIHKLTARQFYKWRESPRARRGAQFDAKQTVFRCEQCSDFTIVRAGKCKRHAEWFPKRHADGASAGCPECIREAQERGDGD